MLTALHYAVDLVARAPRRRGRPGHHPPGGRGLRHAVRADSVGRVPGREPGPDGHAAPAQAPHASTTSWSRWPSSGPGPSRAARCTPTSGAATARSRSPTCTRCSRRRWPRRSACRCSRSSSCRWPSTWPASPPAEADQLRQAMGSKRSRERMERLRAAALRRAWPSGASPARWPTQICEKLAAFANYGFPESHSVSFAYLVYAVVVAQAALPGRVLRRAAQRPADGLLLAALAGAGRPPPRRGGAHAPTSTPRPADGRRSSRARRARTGERGACGSGIGVGARASATTWPRPSPPAGPTPTWRTCVRRVPALALAAARGAGHRGGVRLLRARPRARGAVGGGGGGPEPARTGWPASSPASTPRRCRA